MSQKRIGTHNGKFHCDEALACYLLKLTNQFQGATVVRTRNDEVLATLDCLVDVGGVYNPDKLMFDHHQRGFQEAFSITSPIPLSSAGLIYKHFGREILQNILKEMDDTSIDVLYKHIYYSFIEELDAIDNGVNAYDADLPPRYSISTHLSARVGCLNPAWNDKDADEEDRFQQAMDLAGKEFVDHVYRCAHIWFPARNIVKGAFFNRGRVDSSLEIMVLETACPWKSHLYELEEENLSNDNMDDKDIKSVKYVLYPRKDGSWSVQAVSVSEESFKSRKPLPQSWRGLRDDELSRVVGIPDCVFVHSTGFIGVHKKYEGALYMARMSLSQYESENHRDNN
eukprot:jgi/Galph1/4460/GphlegSOOS_G3052.1